MQPLSILITDTSSIFVRRLTSILILAIVFGLIFGLAEQTFNRQAEANAKSVLGVLGIDDLKLQGLQQRVDQGDQQAIADFTAEMQKRFQAQGKDAMATLVIKQLFDAAKMFLWYYPILWLLTTLLTLPLLLLGISREQGMAAILERSFRTAASFIGMSLWITLRSFIWIPILGWVAAVYLGPRLCLAPVILLSEGKGIRESARESMRRTEGKWGTVVSGLFMVGLGVGVIVMLINFFLALGSPALALYLQSIVTTLGIAFTALFLVKFSGEFRAT
ncbi:MAG: hypothetical protein WCG83_07215 [Candidatus Peregrinibacteria bacterium]